MRHSNSRRRHVRALGAGLLAAAFASVHINASAQDSYPKHPVNVVVGFAAGGGVDAFARLLSTQLSTRLGQQFIVENRAGAAGLISGDRVAKAQPDGYTLLLADFSSLAIAAKANPQVTFNIAKDFAPVAMAATMPLVLAVTPSLPVNSLQELVALAKADPKRLMYASPGMATVHQLSIEWLKQSLGFEMTHVPYRGAAALMPDLMSGQVQVAVMSSASLMAQAKAGQLKVLGVTGKIKVPDAPEWKSLSDVVPGFDTSPRLFLLAPAGTPAPIVASLAAAVKASLESPELLQGLSKLGGVVSYAEGPVAVSEMARETAQWSEVVQRAGVKLE
ncbi:tripartite tricarboxylate transporter substrate binding protein [soil metagenome]